MQNIIDDSYPYELVDENLDHYKYDFVSTGQSDVPKRVSLRPITNTEYYNLGFGDISVDCNGEEVTDDRTRNKNVTDGDKILSTALTCSLDFLTKNPEKKVSFFGNTKAKHRLYKIRLCTRIEALNKYLIIKGAVINNLVVPEDQEGFKDLQQITTIDPNDIIYEDFDTTNCNKYDFITLELTKSE